MLHYEMTLKESQVKSIFVQKSILLILLWEATAAIFRQSAGYDWTFILKNFVFPFLIAHHLIFVLIIIATSYKVSHIARYLPLQNFVFFCICYIWNLAVILLLFATAVIYFYYCNLQLMLFDAIDAILQFFKVTSIRPL